MSVAYETKESNGTARNHTQHCEVVRRSEGISRSSTSDSSGQGSFLARITGFLDQVQYFPPLAVCLPSLEVSGQAETDVICCAHLGAGTIVTVGTLVCVSGAEPAIR